MSLIDYVTAVQVKQRKVRIYLCRFPGSTMEYRFKSASKISVTPLIKSYAIIREGYKGQFKVVEVLRDVTKEFKPEPGLTYQWLVDQIDPRKIKAFVLNMQGDMNLYKEIASLDIEKDVKSLTKQVTSQVDTGKRRRAT